VNEQRKCTSCGGSQMAKGSLHSTGKMTFRPDDAKFLKLKTANVKVDGRLCLECGAILLTADLDKVKELTNEA